MPRIGSEMIAARPRSSSSTPSTGQLREECGLLDRSERGKLLVSGAEAAEYLQGQLTNDVEALGPGEGWYAALLDRKGHMQADMRVLRPRERGDLARHRAGGARRRPAPPRDVQDRPRRRGRRRRRRAGDPLADRPAQRRDRRAPRRCPSTPAKRRASAGVECLAVGTGRRDRPDRRRRRRRSGCATRCSPPGRRRGRRRRRPRSCGSRPDGPASAPR